MCPEEICIIYTPLAYVVGELQKAPTDVSLAASDRFFEFVEGNQMGFNCSAQGGQPPPRVNLTLGNLVVCMKLRIIIQNVLAKL